MIPTDVTPPEDHEARVIVLSDSQIELIAQRVEDRFYLRVGQKVVEKVLWVLGLGSLVLMAWLGGKGLLKP